LEELKKNIKDALRCHFDNGVVEEMEGEARKSKERLDE